ncbi:MAG: hypothetical protein ABIF82_01585 [Planctomycetota bacterium]
MDTSKSRIELIRQRHRKLVLEPRRRIEYALVGDWDGEPLFDEDDLVGACAQSPDSDEDD